MRKGESGSKAFSGGALSWSVLAAYGLGIVAYQIPNGAFATLAMPLFNIELGLSPAWVGAILMIGRIWDALTNPVMGSLSDNTRTRWGRRRPYLLAGALLTGAVYPLIWLVPRGWSQEALAAWLLGGVLLLFTCFTIYSVPYMALGFELTPDTHERTRVQVWRGYFNLVPMAAMGWLYWLCQRPVFGDALQGARWIALAAGALIAVAGMAPGLFIRERYYELSADAGREPFLVTGRAALRNRPFVLLCGVIITIIIGTQSTDALGLYVLSYYVYDGDTGAAAKLYGFGESTKVVVALLALPLLQVIERRAGKVAALRWCIGCNLVGAAAKWFLVRPEHPWTWLIVVSLTQAGQVGFWVLVASMKADACDWDEFNSGRRREGVYGAVGNLLQKLAASLVYLLAGVMLQAVGLKVELKGAQEPHTVLWLRLLFSAVPVAALALCLALLARYRLHERALVAIRTRLERRRSAV